MKPKKDPPEVAEVKHTPEVVEGRSEVVEVSPEPAQPKAADEVAGPAGAIERTMARMIHSWLTAQRHTGYLEEDVADDARDAMAQLKRMERR